MQTATLAHIAGVAAFYGLFAEAIAAARRYHPVRTATISSFRTLYLAGRVWIPSPQDCTRAASWLIHPLRSGRPDKDMFLDNLDDEIDDFLELGLPKSSLLDSLKPKADS